MTTQVGTDLKVEKSKQEIGIDKGHCTIGIQIDHGVPVPNNMAEDPFYRKLDLIRSGGSLTMTLPEATAFQKRAMRCGVQVCFKTTNRDPARPVSLWARC